jgi:hypothetical protein
MNEHVQTIGVRLSMELFQAVQEHQKKMVADNPGIKISISDAVRSMITIAANGKGKKR